MCVNKVQHVTGRKTGCNRSRPVFFGFLIFQQTSQLATEKIQNLCNRNRWSGLFRLGSVRFRSFFQSSELDLRTLVVRAAEDYKIRPHECKHIRVEGQLGEDRDWLVSKNLLAGADDSYFVVPNTLISASNPWVPVANPSDRPRYVRKGEVIGVLSNPEEYFDHVKTLADWEKHCKHAEAIESIIRIQMANDNGLMNAAAHLNEAIKTEEDRKRCDSDDHSESFGAKTAEMPDLTTFPSSRMKDFIDVGSLPDHLHKKAWNMLERRVKAFGFDGRLGHYESSEFTKRLVYYPGYRGFFQ